jgi:hypothetical protein
MSNARYTRYAVAIGGSFVVIGIVFLAIPLLGGWHVDYAGATILITLGIAMAIMAYVLLAGTPGD